MTEFRFIEYLKRPKGIRGCHIPNSCVPWLWHLARCGVLEFQYRTTKGDVWHSVGPNSHAVRESKRPYPQHRFRLKPDE